MINLATNEALTTIVLITHAMATLAMTGLIWFVQIVHYPLFARVGVAAFMVYEREHQARTGLIVAPLMLLELATSAALAFAAPTSLRLLALSGFALTIFLWLWTFLVMVPQHRHLAAEGSEDRNIRQLVRTNWPRTVAWSARGAVALTLLVAWAHEG